MSRGDEDRFIAVGDIHGDEERLTALLSLLAGREERLIFVGDYVNRGPSSKGVIERLLALKTARADSCFLLGNHDFAFRAYLEGGAFSCFARMGGVATIKSYIPGLAHKDVRRHLVDVVPPSHWQFLASLQTYWENERFLVSHAGLDPEAPTDRSLEAMVLRDHRTLFSHGGIPEKITVCGHYIQQSLQPFISTWLVGLDTGCGTRNGPLTAILFPDRRVFSV